MRAFSTAGSGRTPAPGYNPFGLSGTYPVGATPGVKVDVGYGLHGDSTTGHQIDSANNDIRVNVLLAPSPYTIGYPAVNIPVFLLRPPPGAGAGARTVMLPFPVLNNLLDRFAGYSNVQNPAAVARLARYLGICKSDGHTDETPRTMYGGGARAAVVPSGTVPSCWDFWGVEVLGLDRLWLQLRARRIGPDAPPEDDAQDTRYMGKRPRLGEGVPDPAFGSKPAKRPSWAFYYHPVVVKGRELPPPFDWSQVWTPDPFPEFAGADDDTAGDVLMTGAPPAAGSELVDAMKPAQYQPSLLFARRPDPEDKIVLSGSHVPSLKTLQMLYDTLVMYMFNDRGNPLELDNIVVSMSKLLSSATTGVAPEGSAFNTMKLGPVLDLVRYMVTDQGNPWVSVGSKISAETEIKHDGSGIGWGVVLLDSIELPSDDDVARRDPFWDKLNYISTKVLIKDAPQRTTTTNGVTLVTLRSLASVFFRDTTASHDMNDVCRFARPRQGFVKWLVDTVGLDGNPDTLNERFDELYDTDKISGINAISRWIFQSVGKPDFDFTKYYKAVFGKDIPSGKKSSSASQKKSVFSEDTDEFASMETASGKSKTTHTSVSETENAEHWERIRSGVYNIAYYIGVASAAVRDHHKTVKMLKAQTARGQCIVPRDSRSFAKAMNDLPKVNIVVHTSGQGDPAAYHNAQRTEEQCGLDFC